MRELNVGDSVILVVCPNDLGAVPGLLKYADRRFRISKVVNFGAKGGYYELKGCASEEGIPYAIAPGWIVPTTEGKR